MYDHSRAGNHYTFGRGSYYFNNPNNSASNLQNFQQNVNMTLNHNPSTISTNDGFVNLIHPVPLSVSAVEATLHNHLCQGRPNSNPNQTLIVQRSWSNGLADGSNAWRTQGYSRSNKEHNNCQGFNKATNNDSYIHNGNSQVNSLYQDIDTCRYDPKCHQTISLSAHSTSNGNILQPSSDQPFPSGQQTGAILTRHIVASQESSPYAVPGEQQKIKQSLNVTPSNLQTCFYQHNEWASRENHYQNINARYGGVINSNSNHSSIDRLNNSQNVDNNSLNDIWQKNINIESLR